MEVIEREPEVLEIEPGDLLQKYDLQEVQKLNNRKPSTFNREATVKSFKFVLLFGLVLSLVKKSKILS